MLTGMKLDDTNKANVEKLLALVYSDQKYEDDTLTRFLTVISQDLTEKEMQALVVKHGLDGSAVKTLDEASKALGIRRERARQLEARAFRKLRQTSKVNYYFNLFSEPEVYSFDIFSPLTETNLSVRSVNCLKRSNITTVVALLSVKLVDLINTRNLGRKYFEEIVEFVRKNKDIK